MTDREETKLSMYVAVRDFNTINATALNALPSYSTFTGQFNTLVDQIQTIRAQQETDRTGIAGSKAELRKALISQAVDIARKIVAFAQVSGNTTLKAEVDYTQSDLQNAADTILKDRCEIIRQRAAANQAAIAPYGVTAAMVTALQTQITTFLTAIPKPKAALSDRKLVTAKLKTLFDQGDVLLKTKLDALVETVRISNVDLYNGYRNSRALINEHGTQKLAVRVSVTDKATGMPLAMVVCTIAGKKKTKVTTEKGKFQVKNLAAGAYNFSFSKNGYLPTSVLVNVNIGETSEVAVVMEAIGS